MVIKTVWDMEFQPSYPTFAADFKLQTGPAGR